MHKPTKQI
jgi:hypothetical protein